MKAKARSGFVAALGLLLLATSIAGADEPIQVVVSIPPLKYFVETIGEPYVDVYVLVKPGQGPHNYAPTPKDVAALKDADLFFRIGMPFEARLIEKIAKVAPDLRIIDVREKPGDSHIEDPAGYDPWKHVDTDPHVWLDPIAGQHIAHAVAHALRDADPKHSSHFGPRAHEIVDKLQAVDEAMRARLAPYAGRSILVYHPSLGHIAGRYGLTQLAIEAQGKEPGPKTLAAVIDEAKAAGIKVVFVQRQFPTRSARAVAEAIGGEVVEIDPLAENYVGNLKAIGQAIADGLAR